MREDPVDKDEYSDEIVQMDVLMEEWGKFLDESIHPFDLIPRDFHGVLDEKALNNVMSSTWGLRGYKAEIEHEYPDLKDLYAEQIYVKYSTSLYNFFQTMGYPKKTDARAEVGQNDKYFWDAFMQRVEKAAVENVWDLFDYQVALVYGIVCKLSFGKADVRGKEKYSVSKDGAYHSFTRIPIVREAKNLMEKIDNGRFQHTGEGFVAIFVNGKDIVMNLLSGRGDITSNQVCIGIHDWATGEGTTQMVNQDIVLNLSSVVLDYSDNGVMRHRAGTRARHEKKKVV
jgi:hypothetical protein